MENLESIEKAIETAYQSEVANIYKTFFAGMLMAEEDARMIKDAQERFIVGIDHAAKIHKSARTLVGLPVV